MTSRSGRTVARAEAIRLARRINELGDELKTNRAQLDKILSEHVPQRFALPEIGPVTAAVILTVGPHPTRIRSEAAMAKIAGTAPIPASSENPTRHRLSRGSDRRLNRAIHTIVLTRMRTDAGTRAYLQRRLAAGKTKCSAGKPQIPSSADRCAQYDPSGCLCDQPSMAAMRSFLRQSISAARAGCSRRSWWSSARVRAERSIG
ncbi:transposase [Nocardia fluminea]|uniref:transposase n=1 Tax=Nocardia fluminea TaxID=134984 RepID=UPI0036708CB1